MSKKIQRIFFITLSVIGIAAAAFLCIRTVGKPSLDMDKLQKKALEAKAYISKKQFNPDYCILIDMSLHGGTNRLFVWDFKQGRVVHSAMVCHGSGGGSTSGKAVFSNKIGSNCTSLGRYKTGDRSYSNWGIHVHYKLHGLDSTNSNAFRRNVVLHSYEYYPCAETYPAYPPMVSAGCPLVCDDTMMYLDNLLKKSSKPMLLWIYCD